MTAADVVDAIRMQTGRELDRRALTLPDIKALGTYDASGAPPARAGRRGGSMGCCCAVGLGTTALAPQYSERQAAPPGGGGRAGVPHGDAAGGGLQTGPARQASTPTAAAPALPTRPPVRLPLTTPPPARPAPSLPSAAVKLHPEVNGFFKVVVQKDTSA